MIEKLRRRFLIIAMLAVFLVLTLLLGSINVSNYLSIKSNADDTLKVLSVNQGIFPQMEFNNQPAPGDIPPDVRGDHFTAETAFEIRYFTVELDSEGNIINTNTRQIAAVDGEEAKQIAKELYSSNKTSGYYRTYRYLRVDSEESINYYFLDCERDLSSTNSFLKNSLLIGLLGLIGVFILLYAFSGRILKPIADSYAKQKEFITNASHELKTPLSVINSCTDVLEIENGKSKWTDGIRSQVKRLSTLTGSLVSLSYMDEEDPFLQKEEFDLSELCRQNLEPFSLRAEEENKKLKLQIENNIQYKANKKSISQLIDILADNALKYTNENDEITFTLKKQNKNIILSSENKAEISEGKHPELFDRFYRADKNRKSDGSYGIGLSLAQSIVVAHGGKIEATCTNSFLKIKASLPIK